MSAQMDEQSIDALSKDFLDRAHRNAERLKKPSSTNSWQIHQASSPATTTCRRNYSISTNLSTNAFIPSSGPKLPEFTIEQTGLRNLRLQVDKDKLLVLNNYLSNAIKYPIWQPPYYRGRNAQ